jgi:hypothetical protein
VSTEKIWFSAGIISALTIDSGDHILEIICKGLSLITTKSKTWIFCSNDIRNHRTRQLNLQTAGWTRQLYEHRAVGLEYSDWPEWRIRVALEKPRECSAGFRSLLAVSFKSSGPRVLPCGAASAWTQHAAGCGSSHSRGGERCSGRTAQPNAGRKTA